MAPLKLIKINVHIFAMMMTIALRFIPTLIEEIDKISKAQASRGLDMTNGKLKDKIRGIIAIVIPLLVTVFKMSLDLADAMEVRGYDPSAKRTRFRILKLRFADFFALLIAVGVTTFAFLVKYEVVMIPWKL
jgi:energy-coupling factor transport system permease protein